MALFAERTDRDTDIRIAYTYGAMLFSCTEHYEHLKQFYTQLGSIIGAIENSEKAKRKAAARVEQEHAWPNLKPRASQPVTGQNARDAVGPRLWPGL